MTHRSQSILRGLYANVQNSSFGNFVRCSGREAVASTDKHADQHSKFSFSEPSGLERELNLRMFDDSVDGNSECNLNFNFDESDLNELHKIAADEFHKIAAMETTTTPSPETKTGEENVPFRARQISGDSVSGLSFRARQFSTDSVSSLCSETKTGEENVPFRARQISGDSVSSGLCFRARQISTDSVSSLCFRARQISEERVPVRSRLLSAGQAGFEMSDLDFACLFDDNFFLQDDLETTTAPSESHSTAPSVPNPVDKKTGTDVSVPTMAMLRCKLSPDAKEKVQAYSDSEDSHHSSLSAPETEQEPNAVTKCRPRKRPFKNVREKRRRAEIKTKLTELYNMVHSTAEARGLQIVTSGSEDTMSKPKGIPHKMEILTDAIKLLEGLERELVELRMRNKRLRSANNAHEV